MYPYFPFIPTQHSMRDENFGPFPLSIKMSSFC